MICSTLIEQKAAALFLFSSIETGLFWAERALPTLGQRRKQTLFVLLFAVCNVSVRRWQAPFNPEQSRYNGKKKKEWLLSRKTDYLISAAL